MSKIKDKLLKLDKDLFLFLDGRNDAPISCKKIRNIIKEIYDD